MGKMGSGWIVTEFRPWRVAYCVTLIILALYLFGFWGGVLVGLAIVDVPALKGDR